MDTGKLPPSKAKVVVSEQAELFRKAIPDESIKILAFCKKNAPTISVLKVGAKDTIIAEVDTTTWPPSTVKEWMKSFMSALLQMFPNNEVAVKTTNKSGE